MAFRVKKNARKKGEKDKHHKLAIPEITEKILRVGGGRKPVQSFYILQVKKTEAAYEQGKN